MHTHSADSRHRGLGLAPVDRGRPCRCPAYWPLFPVYQHKPRSKRMARPTPVVFEGDRRDGGTHGREGGTA